MDTTILWIDRPIGGALRFKLDELCNRAKFWVLERPIDLAGTILQQEGVDFNVYIGVDLWFQLNRFLV